MSKDSISRQIGVIRYGGPCYVPRDGVVYGIDAEYAESDPRHFWPLVSVPNAVSSLRDVRY